MRHLLQVSPQQKALQTHAIQDHPELGVTVHTLYYPYDSRYLHTSIDLTSFFAEALTYIQKNDITGVFSGKDLGSLISAMIAEKCGFSGPSVESVFLTLHKQLTKTVTASPVASELWDITKPFPHKKLPLYLKAPYSSLGSLGFLIKTEHDLQTALQKIHKLLPDMNKPFIGLLSQTNIIQKYPESVKHTMAIEPLIQAPQVTVEGFVHRHNVQPTIITDTNFKGQTNLFDNFSTPSQLALSIQERIKTQVIKDITALGLNTTFFNAEYWIRGEEILLIEVNARAVFSFSQLYKMAWGYDVFANVILLAQDKLPDIPHNAQQTAGQFNIFTTDIAQKDKVQQLRESIPGIKTFVNLDSDQEPVSDHGAVALQFELTGSSYSEIFEKAESYRALVR